MNPKKDFAESNHFAAFTKMVDTPAMKAAVESCLLQFVVNANENSEPDFHQIMGARKFAKSLLGYHLKVEVEPRKPIDNLNHRP